MTTEAADLNYPEEWLQPEPFAKHFVSYGAVKAAYYDIYDEEEYEIWVSPKISTAATRYDKESGKHLIFVGNTLEEMENTSTKRDVLSLVSSLIIHECGHILYTEKDLGKINGKLREYEIPFSLFNLAEDGRIERLIMDRIGKKTGKPFRLGFSRWLRNAREHANMSPESILFNIINEEGRRIPPALHAEEVHEFYLRFIGAKDSMEVVEILREWAERWHVDRTRKRGKTGLEQAMEDLREEVGDNMRFDDADEILDENGEEVSVEELKEDAVPAAGVPSTGVELSAPFRVDNKGELERMDDFSNTRGIFSGPPGEFDHKEALDIQKVLKRIADMKKRRKVAVKKPTKRLNSRRVSMYATTLSNTKPYKRPIALPSRIKDKKIMFILDLSGSMSGAPVRAQRTLLIGANRLAAELPQIEITVLGSKIEGGYIYETVRLPGNEEQLLAIRATGGGEGIAYALESNRKLAKEQDILVFITDGMVAKNEVSRERIERNLKPGALTFGAYVGPRGIANREMENWFDHLVVGERVSEVFSEIVDRILEAGGRPGRRPVRGVGGEVGLEYGSGMKL